MREKLTGKRKQLHNEELPDNFFTPDIIMVIKSRGM